MWGIKKSIEAKCIHLGGPTGGTVSCPTCNGRVELKLFECKAYGECTLVKSVAGIACCNGTRGPEGRHVPCEKYSIKEEPETATEPRVIEVSTLPVVSPRKRLKWSYGVTTVPERLESGLLVTTLNSLNSAGFDKPRIFIDGDKENDLWRNLIRPKEAGGLGFVGLEMTFRYPRIRTHGNWVLTLYELFIREPTADRYAVFQDDFITCKNLRAYLESVPYPDKGYLNLYTFPANQARFPMEGQTGRQRFGWMLSNQFGRGAVALVFNREVALALLSSPHMVERPLDPNRGWKAVDGGIVTALAKVGIKEYVHNPSLVQHTGLVSSMRNKPHKLAESFQGEEFDALELLRGN